MKQKLFALILILALAVPAYALSDGQTQAPFSPPPGCVSTPAEGPEEFIPGSVPAEAWSLEPMIAPINALVMCMAERDLDYNADSAVFQWNALYYMLSLYGWMDSRAQFTDDTLTLPAETVRDYAEALFPAEDGLPALPAELEGRVRYDAGKDCYLLARGDEGLSETVFDDTERLPGGLTRITGAMLALEDGSVLYPFRATLRANDSMFGFTICALELL